jgi:hypothetical protein
MQTPETHTTRLIPLLGDAEDALARAFPAPATFEAAHNLIGDAISTLVDRGHSLKQARSLVQRAVTALIHVYEC